MKGRKVARRGGEELWGAETPHVKPRRWEGTGRWEGRGESAGRGDETSGAGEFEARFAGRGEPGRVCRKGLSHFVDQACLLRLLSHSPPRLIGGDWWFLSGCHAPILPWRPPLPLTAPLPSRPALHRALAADGRWDGAWGDG